MQRNALTGPTTNIIIRTLKERQVGDTQYSSETAESEIEKHNTKLTAP